MENRRTSGRTEKKSGCIRMASWCSCDRRAPASRLPPEADCRRLRSTWNGRGSHGKHETQPHGRRTLSSNLAPRSRARGAFVQDLMGKRIPEVYGWPCGLTLS